MTWRKWWASGEFDLSAPALASFAVGEIEKAIVAGHSAAGRGAHAAGFVAREDVEALRNTVFAATQGSSLHVTRDSAEALFRIAHATAGADNDAAFDELFAQAIGNYLMGVAFSGTPDRADVLRHEAELEKATGFGGFFAAMARGPSRAEVAEALESTEAEEEDAYFRDLQSTHS